MGSKQSDEELKIESIGASPEVTPVIELEDSNEQVKVEKPVKAVKKVQIVEPVKDVEDRDNRMFKGGNETRTFTSNTGVTIEAKSGRVITTSWKMFVPLMFIPLFAITGFAFSTRNHKAVQSANRQKIEATHSV